MATGKKEETTSEKKVLTGNHEITIEKYKCVMSPPNRFVVQAAMAEMTNTNGKMDMVGAGMIVFNSCKISCDKEIEKSDRLLVSAYLACAQLIEVAEATIKKI